MVPNQEALTNYLNRELQVIQTRFSHYEINTYYELYQNIDFPLQQIFSALHYELNQIFSHLNTRIPHGYFKADDSRYLLELIRRISNYQTKLHNTEYQFNLATYYSRLFTECKKFLEVRGSEIPELFDEIEIEEFYPIFILESTIKIDRPNSIDSYKLKNRKRLLR
ncbi:hypothetical protein ACT7CM_10530 [Bacillus paranthracis]